jgi:hypothetical protein
MKSVLKSSFTAKDASGVDHALEVWAEVLDSGDEGWKTIQAADGRKVNRLSKGHYKVVGTGAELTSDDPNAP